MPWPEHSTSPREHPAPAGFPPLMGWACDGIGGSRWAPLLPASPTPSAHHAGRPLMPPESPLPIVRRPRPSFSWQAAPRPSFRPRFWTPRKPHARPLKTSESPRPNVTEHSDFPGGEITASLLLRKKHVPTRVRHASESTRHHHTNHHTNHHA